MSRGEGGKTGRYLPCRPETKVRQIDPFPERKRITPPSRCGRKRARNRGCTLHPAAGFAPIPAVSTVRRRRVRPRPPGALPSPFVLPCARRINIRAMCADDTRRRTAEISDVHLDGRWMSVRAGLSIAQFSFYAFAAIHLVHTLCHNYIWSGLFTRFHISLFRVQCCESENNAWRD